jgi:tRNA(Leu) C34 or U34 (ribose-2'-O)-methylase TrmL
VALLSLHAFSNASPVSICRARGYRPQGSSIFNCYLFGNEARGLPDEQLGALSAKSFTLAGCGTIESLNLASAVNMCVYELNR